MTCAEFWEMQPKGPFIVTRAERTAFLGHMKTCQQCGSRLLEMSRRNLRDLSVVEQAIDLLPALRKLRAGDVMDPESSQ